MTGATGNIYCGLHDFEEMAFVLHALRPGDLFLDVGANVGSYTVLAAGVAHARTISCEPSPATFRHLLDNIRANDLAARADARNVALGSARGHLKFTTGLDTVNHILSDTENGDSIEVEVFPLDELLASEPAGPRIIKIDVEGFETQVISGASATLKSPALLAVLMELNGSGNRYGFDEAKLNNQILSSGFSPCEYEPFTRKVTPSTTPGTSGNTLYVSRVSELAQLLQAAPVITVNGTKF